MRFLTAISVGFITINRAIAFPHPQDESTAVSSALASTTTQSLQTSNTIYGISTLSSSVYISDATTSFFTDQSVVTTNLAVTSTIAHSINHTLSTTTSSANLPTSTSTLTPVGSGTPTGFSLGGKIGCGIGAAVVVGLLVFWLRPKKRKRNSKGRVTSPPDTKDAHIEKQDVKALETEASEGTLPIDDDNLRRRA